MTNARVIRDGLAAAGFTVYGGRNAPYIWFRTPAGVSSWDFFDRLLADAQIVGAPGAGFGPSGEGYFRLTAFARASKPRKRSSGSARGFTPDAGAHARRRRKVCHTRLGPETAATATELREKSPQC